MYVGGASATHGIDTIIEAAKCLQEEKNENVHFIFIGADKQKKYYIDAANTYQLKNIEFRGSIPKSKVAQAQEEADVLVASVKDTPVYQFGINSNKVFDYFASGRPIVFAAKTPNNPVADANAGISIPPDDPKAMVAAIKTILSMLPEKRRIMGENGRKYAEIHFDVSLLAKKLENILVEIVVKGNSSI